MEMNCYIVHFTPIEYLFLCGIILSLLELNYN
uniref:Uncharacterized protein n=1 Tax=Anguilla anguilla TaxID=7936 RepID=A0A0E9WJH1_ANGAN